MPLSFYIFGGLICAYGLGALYAGRWLTKRQYSETLSVARDVLAGQLEEHPLPTLYEVHARSGLPVLVTYDVVRLNGFFRSATYHHKAYSYTWTINGQPIGVLELDDYLQTMSLTFRPDS